MMEKLITVRDVKARYGCSSPTARKYIRQCNPHMEDPLAAPEWAFREWEERRTVTVVKDMTKKEYNRLLKMIQSDGKITVPRRR